MTRNLDGTITIKGIEYVEFSCLKASEGGIAQVDAIDALTRRGIKVRKGAYTPYIGHYGLYVQADRRDEASTILFG